MLHQEQVSAASKNAWEAVNALAKTTNDNTSYRAVVPVLRTMLSHAEHMAACEMDAGRQTCEKCEPAHQVCGGCNAGDVRALARILRARADSRVGGAGVTGWVADRLTVNVLVSELRELTDAVLWAW